MLLLVTLAICELLLVLCCLQVQVPFMILIVLLHLVKSKV
jgi:hypothetical protein